MEIVRMSGLVVSGVLTSGDAEIVDMRGKPLPATVWVVPAEGDTVLVSYSLDNGTTYKEWPNGEVTTADDDVLTSGVTHLKIERTAGSGTTSTFGIC